MQLGEQILICMLPMYAFSLARGRRKLTGGANEELMGHGERGILHTMFGQTLADYYALRRLGTHVLVWGHFKPGRR